MNPEIDQDTIRRCQQGDLHAYKMVYDHFEQSLLRLGMTMLGQQEDAEDAVQNAFLRLYRGIDQFNFDSKFGTYLYRIMINACLDLRRKKGRERLEELPPIEPSHLPAHDLRLQLQQAISLLPERMRACFVLFAIDDMKQTDIADVMDLSIGTVKAHIFQAKLRLQALLTDFQSEVKP